MVLEPGDQAGIDAGDLGDQPGDPLERGRRIEQAGQLAELAVEDVERLGRVERGLLSGHLRIAKRMAGGW